MRSVFVEFGFYLLRELARRTILHASHNSIMILTLVAALLELNSIHRQQVGSSGNRQAAAFDQSLVFFQANAARFGVFGLVALQVDEVLLPIEPEDQPESLVSLFD